jgi:hypothetical protein
VTSQAASSRRARRGGSRARRARAGRLTAIVLGTLLITTIATTAWIASRALSAAEHLTTAQTLAGDIQNTLTTDPTAATTTATHLAEETAAARAATDDPLYTAAAHLPWIGPQLHALATITTTLDDLTHTGLTPLLDVAANLDVSAFAPQDGRIDLEPLTRMQDPAATAATAAAQAAASLHTLDTTTLIGALAGPVTQAQTLLDTVADGTDALHRATVLLPRVLGQNEPRDYLILFQNNAEWRSLGGLASAQALIRTTDGSITLQSVTSSATFKDHGVGILSLGPDIEGIYGTDPARWMQNATMVPDFSVAALVAKAFWEDKYGDTLDGVIALDPVTLSYLLEATGPIRLATGDILTPLNAVHLLLNEVYWRYEDPHDQDAFFAATTEAIFRQITTGHFDPVRLVEALARAGSENRLLMWSARDDEQLILGDTPTAGTLPRTDASTTRFGVYVNDGSGAKMNYYSKLETSASWCGTDAEGRGLAQLSVQLRNNAPENAAALPDYITGYDQFVPRGTIRTFTYLYLPEDAVLLSESYTTGTVGPGLHDGLQVIAWVTDLRPGELAAIELLVNVPMTEALEVVSTPTLALVPADGSAGFAANCVP